MSELDRQMRDIEFELFLLIDKHQSSKEQDRKEILQKINQLSLKLEKLYEEVGNNE